MYILILSAVICTWVVFSISASAVGTAELTLDSIQPDMTLTIEELNIVPDQAILEGQTKQMQIEDFAETVVLGSVEWSSSNPDVISCTNTGQIKGLKEGSAIITVKAKLGDASDKITVYCARKLSSTRSSRIVYPLAWSCKTPFFLNVQAVHINVFPLVMTEKLDVKGVYGSFFYVEFERNEKQYAGFIPQNWMPSSIASGEIFRQLSTYNLEVFVGKEDESNVVTTNYKGSVNWKVSPENIIDFNDKTGKVTGKRGGVAVISATVGTKTLKCTVHSIYVWPLEWTGAARQETCVYRANGSTYEATSTKLAVGDEFTVIGDMGGDSYWVYGVSESGTEGYIPISHISTKGTVSQYNSFNWAYPIYNNKFKSISSVYGWRKSGRHLGFDINKGEYSSILGEQVVATSNGKVVFVNKAYNESNQSPNYGYCVVIESQDEDPVSKNKLRIVYMHLNEPPQLNLGDTVEKGQLVGKVGSTGNSSGPHLHLEINNKGTNFAGVNNLDSFDKTINPVFFYLYDNVKDAFDTTNNEYWYNDEK